MSDNIPPELRYTASHEWVRVNADGTVTIGITDAAQHALGEIVFVEVPDTDRALAAGEACAVVESVKAASDVYSPIDGSVVAVNTQLQSAPEKVNQLPYTEGWLFQLKPKDAGAVAALLDAKGYRAVLDTSAVRG